MLGNVAMQAVIGEKGIKQKRGKPIEKDGVIYLPTYHPSYALRDPNQEVFIETDLKLLLDIVNFGGVPKERNLNIQLVNSVRDFQEMQVDLAGETFVSFDIETNGLYPFPEDAKIVSIGFGTKRFQWIIPFGHPDYEGPEAQKIVDWVDSWARKKLKLIMHNGKFDSLWMKVHFDVDWPVYFDTMLAHYVLDENMRHDLKMLSQLYCRAPDYDIDLSEKTGHTTIEKLAEYHAHDLYYTRKLWKKFSPELKRHRMLNKTFRKIIMPTANMFVQAEHRGVKIDVKRMKKVERELRARVEKSLDELSEYGPDINWRSPQQVAKLLFEDLGIKPLDKTAGGKPSTSESVLKRIDHPATEALLQYRHDDQQLKMFIDGWKPYLIHGRLHPSFKIHGTVTGRLSCENPNLQQVPRDKTIRTLITAPKGWTLVEADLSQVELRIAADMSGEPNMLRLFNEDADIHWMTAISELARGGGEAELVKKTAKKYKRLKKLPTYSKAVDILLEMGPDKAVEIDYRWKELRKKAKAVNFGYLYGMWWRKFKIYARDNYGVKVDDKQAQASRENFFSLYPGLLKWHTRQKQFAQMNGFVASYNGRRRRLPRAQDFEDSYEKQEALRQAINSPVQSFANELNLMAAIQLHGEFHKRGIFHIVGTVHDSILMEVKDEYLDEVVPRVLEAMSHPDLLDDFKINMKVPIIAEAEVGPWGGGKKWQM